MVTEILEGFGISLAYDVSIGISVENPDHLPWISIAGIS